MRRTFVVSYALMFLINLIPGCKFRVDEEGEIIGVDEVEVRSRLLSFRRLEAHSVLARRPASSAMTSSLSDEKSTRRTASTPSRLRTSTPRPLPTRAPQHTSSPPRSTRPKSACGIVMKLRRTADTRFGTDRNRG